jgi:hypothetical protein
MMKPPFITMHAAKHSRESAVKDDDQIAFENASSCEEVGRQKSALEWYAEVKQTGGRWDVRASKRRVMLLLVLGHPARAVSIGLEAMRRMLSPDVLLIHEVVRAMNAHCGPFQALDLSRQWLSQSNTSGCPYLWYTAAGYAALCHQFSRSLRYLVRSLDLSSWNCIGDLFLDFDFAPLWEHLNNAPLKPTEAGALRLPHWQQYYDRLSKVSGELGFESIEHVPSSLRHILRIDIRNMTWQPRSGTSLAKLATYKSWSDAVRMQARESLDRGLRKALAMQPASSGDCA